MRSASLAAVVFALIAVALAAAACLMFPLTANAGPESAQVLGVVGGLALCLAQAARASERRQDGYLADLTGGFILGLAMLGIFLLATAVGNAMRPSCGGDRGTLPFVLLAVPVLSLHAALGTWIGRLVGRPLAAVAVGVVVEVIAALVLFLSWYRSPGLQLTSHFFVVVAGDLTRGSTMPPVVMGYRSATLLFAVALALFGAAQFPRIRRTGLTTQVMSNPALLGLAVAALVVGTTVHVFTADAIAPAHEDLEARYSLVKQRGRLVVHADPVATVPRDVDAILAEGTLWLERLALRLGQHPSDNIHVWLHANSEVKGAWTGARNVDFALPWRREVHISSVEIPHPTLGHELAHVVAGELTDTPLRIPSDLVVFYRAAVVEGLAVALTPELALRDDLTVKELAAAMKRAGQAPPSSTLFAGLSFFTEAPSRAYVAAGAFIESLAARALPDPRPALSALYRRGRIEDAVGGSAATEDLIAAHDSLLDNLALPKDAALVAALRFARPSLLRDVCVSEDSERIRTLRTLTRTGLGARALNEAGPQPSRATIEDLLADARAVRDFSAAVQLARALEELDTPEDQPLRTVLLGDVLWQAGQLREAQAAWMRAELELLPLHTQRSLLAKRVFAETIVRRAGRAPVAAAAVDVLVSDTVDARADAFARLHYWLGVNDGSPGELRREPRETLVMARYIHARRLLHVGSLEDAEREFRRLLDEQELGPQFIEQCRLGLATAVAKLGRGQDAEALFMAGADAADRAASRLTFRDRAERAARASQAPAPPTQITATSPPAWADRLLLGAEESGPL